MGSSEQCREMIQMVLREMSKKKLLLKSFMKLITISDKSNIE